MRQIHARLVVVVALLALVLPVSLRGPSALAVGSSNPDLISDIQTIRGEMNPFIATNISAQAVDAVAVLGNNLLFAAVDPVAGNELFISDGTRAGTRLLKDINSGSFNSNPTSLRTFGNYVYFSAATAANGSEIWRSDGTEVGTTMVADYSPGSASSNGRFFTATSNAVYFSCTSTASGTEMCKLTHDANSNASVALLKDIAPGASSAQVGRPVAVGDKIFFTAADGTNGSELWVSDGTSAGTTLVKDINTGDNTVLNLPLSITPLDANRVVFWGSSSTTGYEPWVSDGTSNGTFKLAEINASSAASYNSTYPFISAFNGTAYFFANNGTSIEMWKTDGTSVGTMLTADPVTGAFMHNGGGRLWEFNNKLFYIGTCTISVGAELCSYDPVTNTFSLVMDFLSGASNGGSIETTGATSSISRPAVVIGSKFYLPGTTSATGTELWESDGTTSGTVLLKDINIAPNNSNTRNANVNALVPFRGGFAFSASTNGFSVNQQPYFSDGTAVGTISLEPSNNGTFGQSIDSNDSAYNAITDGQYTYFIGETTRGTPGLVRTDGTAAGTSNAIVVSPHGNVINGGFGIAKLGRNLLMSANSGNGNEMFTYNLDTGATATRDIWAGSSSSSAAGFYPFANGTKALFYANDGTRGSELWVTDGTVNGTSMVRELAAGAASGVQNSPGFFELNGYVYFWGNSTTEGVELWRSDGTAAGTELFSDINPGAASSGTPSSQLANIAGVGNLLVVCATNPTLGTELHTIDTTAAPNTANFTMVRDVFVGGSSGCRGGVSTFGNKVVFMGDTAANGTEMWVSDLTNAGTTLLVDVSIGSGQGLVYGNNYGDRNLRMPIINGVGYFIASDSSRSFLYKTDGTSAGTSRVSNTARPMSNGTLAMSVVGGKLYFASATTDDWGSEPWVSDGTSNGTFMLGDLSIGANSSTPFQWGQLANGNVFFMAKGTWVGYEPYEYDPSITSDGIASAVTAPPLTTTTTTTTTTVAPASQSITFGSLPDRVYGVAPFAVSATSTSNLPVTFTSSTNSVCTVNSSTVTVISNGTCSVVAAQSGNSTFAPASSVTQSFVVATKSISLINAVGIDKDYDGSLNATVNFNAAQLSGVESGDTVTFSSSSYSASFSTAGAAAGKTITVSGVVLTGTHASKYALVQPLVTATVNALPLVITANSLSIAHGALVSPSISHSTLQGGDSIGSVSYTYAGVGLTTYASSSIAPASAGTYEVTPSNASFSSGSAGNYVILYVAAVLTIAAPTTTTPIATTTLAPTTTIAVQQQSAPTSTSTSSTIPSPIVTVSTTTVVPEEGIEPSIPSGTVEATEAPEVDEVLEDPEVRETAEVPVALESANQDESSLQVAMLFLFFGVMLAAGWVFFARRRRQEEGS